MDVFVSFTLGLVLTCCFVVAEVTSFKVEISNDFFFGYGGHVMQQFPGDNSTKTFTRPSSLRRLEILANDALINQNNAGLCRSDGTPAKHTTTKQKPINEKILFKEIAEKVGFKHIYKHRQPSKSNCRFDTVVNGPNNFTATFRGEGCFQEKMTGGMAVGDYDNDGWDDAFFTVYYGSSLLYRNNGDGTFTDVTKSTKVGPVMYGNGAGWVDIDSDGDLDLYVTTVGDSRHYLYINQGGYFTEEAKQRGLSLEFESKRLLAGFQPTFGDYDRDGFLDVYTTEWILQSSMKGESKMSGAKLLRNLGKTNPGYFVDTTDEAGVNMDANWNMLRTSHSNGTHVLAASFTDFDNDGWQDLFVNTDFGQSRVFWNNRNGTFRSCKHQCGLGGFQDAMGLAIGDLDRDGKQDVFQSAIYYSNKSCQIFTCFIGTVGNSVLLNVGNGTFRMANDKYGVRNSKWAWGAAMFDYDNDGQLDIAVTNGFEVPSTTLDDEFGGVHNIQLFHNQGRNRPMQEITESAGLNFNGMGRGLLVFDFDKDGDEDILVANNIGAPRLFENEGGNRKNWIRIRPMHKCENHAEKLCDSYGAKVYVSTSDKETQSAEVGSKTHFLGQSEITCHFGTGNFNRVNITVYWPRFEKTVTLQAVSVKQTLRITPDLSDQEVVLSPNIKDCDPLRVKSITQQPNDGTILINPDGKTVSYVTPSKLSLNDVGVQYFQYSIEYENQVHFGNVTLDLRGKPPFFIPAHCFKPGSHIPRENSSTDTGTIRTLDGRHNNKKQITWGSTNVDLKRLTPPAYADNISEPSGGCTRHHALTKSCPYPHGNSGMGSTRPSPRTISNKLFKQIEDVPSKRKLSDMIVHFGQFLSHDLDHSTTLPRMTFLQFQSNQLWLPIKVPKSDPQFDPYNTGKESISFVRSNFNGCTGTYMLRSSPRQQVNIITAFIDGNMIYGSDQQRSDHLREFNGGRLRTGKGDLLPKNDQLKANENPIHRPGKELFLSGDLRSNVQPVLTALHVVFLREHNRLAKEYLRGHIDASDEEAFQHARKMIIAQLQAITYNEYLPAILGPDNGIREYSGYKENVDAGITTEFSTAAFRFGHSQVNTKILRFQEGGESIPQGPLLLRDAYFKPSRLEHEGGVDPLLRGSVRSIAQEVDLLMVDEMRDNLFPQDAASPGQQTGFDLAAFNVQRGRDHGIGDLNSVRKALGMKAYTSFDEITSNKARARKLQSVYKDINTIDLWVGGLAEDHVTGAEVGETFYKIIKDQFTKLRDGDRFWYQDNLTPNEVKEVESSTLSEIIKRNTKIKDFPSDVFFSTQHCKQVLNRHTCLSHADNSHQQQATVNHSNKDSDDDARLQQFTIVVVVLAIVILILVMVLSFSFIQRSKVFHKGTESVETANTSIEDMKISKGDEEIVLKA